MISKYYDLVWSRKDSLPQYARVSSRWRSRWDFALTQTPRFSQVLDVGCGDGTLGKMLVQQNNCRVLGLEISGYARTLAKAHGITALDCDISKDSFPVRENQFDVATLLCCLEHVFDPVHALRETMRSVKMGGRLLVTLPNAVHLANRSEFLFGRLSTNLLHTRDGEGLHIRFFNYRHDFERLIEAEIEGLRFISKNPALKNPRRHGPLARSLLQWGVRVWPNLLAEYSHYVLEKIQ